jgi:hypothetical protein
MLRLLSETASILKWVFRLALVASIGFVLNAYNQPASRTGAATEGSYAGDIQQALAALKELAQAGKP